jgi:ArsR family transcriptional regulator
MKRPRLALYSALTPNDAAELAGTWKAIAEPSRLQIISALHAADRWVDTPELRAVLSGQAKTTVLHHLLVLEAAGIIKRTVVAGIAAHRLLPDAFDGVLSALRGGR